MSKPPVCRRCYLCLSIVLLDPATALVGTILHHQMFLFYQSLRLAGSTIENANFVHAQEDQNELRTRTNHCLCRLQVLQSLSALVLFVLEIEIYFFSFIYFSWDFYQFFCNNLDF